MAMIGIRMDRKVVRPPVTACQEVKVHKVVASLDEETLRQFSPFRRGRSAGARGEVYGLAPLIPPQLEVSLMFSFRGSTVTAMLTNLSVTDS
jgi:hypothetical protein